jgi:hypothetical protein
MLVRFRPRAAQSFPRWIARARRARPKELMPAPSFCAQAQPMFRAQAQPFFHAQSQPVFRAQAQA